MIYRFNNTEVNLIQFEVRTDDVLLSVEPKVFDLIVYLIEHRNQVISRDELFEQVWQGREVSDTSLSNHIKTARKLLGDNGELQCVIKTIRSRGYQFVANVSQISTSEQKSHIATASADMSENDISNRQPEPVSNAGINSRLMGVKLLLAIVCAVFVLVVSIFYWGSTDAPVKVNSKTDQSTILVVPFSISSHHSETWEPFADQVTRELIQALRKVSGVKTIAPPSSFTFKNNKIRSHIQQQLPNVNYVLDGVVSEGADGNIRITVELEDIQTSTLLWDQDYDVQVSTTNRFDLQAQVAKSVTRSLQVIMLEDEKQLLNHVPTNNLVAYDLYVEGRHQLSLMSYQSVLKAIDYFSQAIELDPAFEEPYIAKSNAYRIIMTYFDKPKDILPKVISSATDLLRINPQSAQVMSLLGLAYVHALQWQEALDMLTKAQQQDPTLVLTELGFTLYYTAIGDIPNLKKSLEKANALDPLNEEVADWGLWALMMVNELDSAIEWGIEKVKLHPNNPYPMMGLSVAYYMNGALDKSLTLARKGVELSNRAPLPLILLAQSHASAGNVEQANALILEAKAQDEYMCPYETAAIYAILKQPQQMYDLLDTAVDYQSNCLIFTKSDPRFSAYKQDAKYLKILTDIGL
ncbi:winged helix-turn-helix domain-containing protein [Paraglaciecola sp.]|uniref:winged helix-turn-helix domain-containing protein n=1 Tax=Paraglaciecola sp. TaxID=1920173 RepID=UPI003EF53C15